MKNYFYIFILNLQIRSLEKKRRDMVNRIGVHYSKEAGRLNSIEDFRPSFFKDIDGKINSRKRLIKVIKTKQMTLLI